MPFFTGFFPASDSAGPARQRVNPATQAFRRFKATRVFGSLDGLRALSILAVVWFHTLVFPPGSMLAQGNHGVTLFFAISGFLIVTLILREKQTPRGFSLARFWGRRSLRILPLYYAVLLMYVVLVAWAERDPAARATFWSNLPAFATFTANWFVNLEDTRVIFYFAWSLAAEEQFYLVWPNIERWLKGWAPLALGIVALVATQGLAVAVGTAAREEIGLRIATSIPPAILSGVVLAHLLHRPQTYRWVWRLLGGRGAAWGALGFVLAALAWGGGGGAVGALWISLALAALVGACVVREDHDFARVLAWRPLAWIGTVSYGMYLLHMIAVNVVRRAAGAAGVASPWLDFLGGTLLAIALASLSYVTFERFFLRLKDRWFGATRPVPPETDEPVAKTAAKHAPA